jgi:hypothetical protein
MAQIAPPDRPPLVALSDDDGRMGRLHLRLWQWWCTLITVALTAWISTMGPIPAIIAIVTAKHVLVAIYVMGIGVDAPREAEL